MAAAVIAELAPMVLTALPMIINSIQGQVAKSRDDKKMLQAAQSLQRDRDDIDRLLENQQQMSKNIEGMGLLIQHLRNGTFDNNNQARSSGTPKLRIEFDLPDDPDERDIAITTFWRNMAKFGAQYVENEQSLPAICHNKPGSFSCGVCIQRYNTQKHKPILLPCGHTICKRCLVSHTRNKKCPKCSKPLNGNVNDFPVNFSLLDYMNEKEDRNPERRTAFDESHLEGVMQPSLEDEQYCRSKGYRDEREGQRFNMRTHEDMRRQSSPPSNTHHNFGGPADDQDDSYRCYEDDRYQSRPPSMCRKDCKSHRPRHYCEDDMCQRSSYHAYQEEDRSRKHQDSGYGRDEMCQRRPFHRYQEEDRSRRHQDSGYSRDEMCQRRPFHRYQEEDRSCRHQCSGHRRDERCQRGASCNYREEDRQCRSCHSDENEDDKCHRRPFSNYQEGRNDRSHYYNDEQDERHQRRNSAQYPNKGGCYRSQHSTGCDGCRRKTFHNWKEDNKCLRKQSFENENESYGSSRYQSDEKDRDRRMVSQRQEAILNRYEESNSFLQGKPYSHCEGDTHEAHKLPLDEMSENRSNIRYDPERPEQFRKDGDAPRADVTGFREEGFRTLPSQAKTSGMSYDEYEDDDDNKSDFCCNDSKGNHKNKIEKECQEREIDWKNLKEEEDLELAMALSLSMVSNEQERSYKSDH